MLSRKILDFIRFFPTVLLWLLVFLLIWWLSSCQSGGGIGYGLGNSTQVTPNGVKYVFFEQKNAISKARAGDLFTFHLIVQNHQNQVLSSTYDKYREAIHELPFEENYFIGKPFFKDIFQMVSEGDSLSFWINVDSLSNKGGFLNSPKIPKGTELKYTLKILKINSKAQIKEALQKNMRAQRKLDDQLIADFVLQLKKKDSTIEIHQTESGLRYFFLQKGKGKTPHPHDTLNLNYVSKLLQGKVYDHSENTTEFILGQVVPTGLNEGLSLLSEGSKAVFILPSGIAFGEKGMSSVVPPNSVLIYEVELVKIK
jgi:FKBP-type peptidyl-prolyl cis-trans isomerase FkpA